MRTLAISRTPLRISLFGGGTDLPDFYREHGGKVLSCAINQYVHVVVNKRSDDQLVIRCEDREQVATSDDVSHPLVREALTATGHATGLEIVSFSDVHAFGTGLGSSSAFTVGLLHALTSIRGVELPAEQLAETACRIEIDLLGQPVGKQDQYAAALGGWREYTFHPDGTVGADPVSLPAACADALHQHTLLFDTGRARQAREVLADQRARIKTTTHHLRSIKQLVDEGRRCLEASDMSGLGELLHAGWELKRQLSDLIHDEVIDAAYPAARAAGAYGGKLLGAGGGGFMLLLCPPERQDLVRAALRDFREAPVQLGAPGTAILARA